MLEDFLRPDCTSLISWCWWGKNNFVGEDFWHVWFAYDMEVGDGSKVRRYSARVLEN
jgi:hypothetical protein